MPVNFLEARPRGEKVIARATGGGAVVEYPEQRTDLARGKPEVRSAGDVGAVREAVGARVTGTRDGVVQAADAALAARIAAAVNDADGQVPLVRGYVRLGDVRKIWVGVGGAGGQVRNRAAGV